MRTIKIFLLMVYMIFPSYAYAQREWALNQPIIEGKSLLGINLGDSESDVFKILGFPDKIESNFLTSAPASQQGLKFILYGLNKNNLIFIFTRDGRVEVIQLLWTGQGIPDYKGKTVKGIGLGDSMDAVRQHYGECEMSRGFCWYKNYGISLGGDKVVIFVQIAPAGKELPDYLKPNF